MRKLVAFTFVTLDGVMQAAANPNEDREGGFEYGGWQLEYVDPTVGATIMESLASADAFLLGRRTYEIFASYWPNQPPSNPAAGPFNALRKYVVSTTLAQPLSWHNSTVIDSDVEGTIQRLKDQTGKEIHVIGSGQLMQSLMKSDLIDEFLLMIHPLVIGSGKRLFRELPSPMRLRLLESETSGTGVLIARFSVERDAG